MANLEIIIEANGRKAIENLAQTTRSVSAIRNEIINLTNDATPLEDKQERLIALNREYVQALQRDIAVIETLKDGEKALAKEYAKVSEEMTRIRVGIGANSEAYKNLEKELEVVTQKQELLNKLERDKKEKAPVDPEIDSINRRAEAYEKLFGSMARLNTQRSQLESLYLARSENGASETALKRTEQELAKVIALQKQAREEEEKLSAQTKWDAQVKDIEKNNQYLRQYSTELNAVSKTLEAYTKLQREAFVNEDNDKLSQTSAKIAQLRTEYDALIQKQQELDKQASFDNKLADIETNYQATMLYGTELEALKEKYRALTSMGKELFKQGEYERADTIARKAREVGAEIERIETAVEQPKKSKIKLLEITKNIIKFQLIMKPLTSLMSGFTRTISTSMKVAAEAEQIFSKLATVFQDQAAAMSVATTAAQQYGTATSTMANSLSTIGDLLQAQGMGKYESLELAEQWAGFFSDIIAFKDINMSLDEFAQNFMSGAAGNLRNFRSFGSIVRESAVQAELAKRGLEGLTGAELEQEKMIIRATMALEQQQNALGATAREWDTMQSVNRRFNESWKQWQENLGTIINTTLKPMKTWLTEILEVSNKVFAMQQEMKSGEYTIKVTQRNTSNDTALRKMFLSLGANAYNSKDAEKNFIEIYRQMRLGQTSPLMQQESIKQTTEWNPNDIAHLIIASGYSVADALDVIAEEVELSDSTIRATIMAYNLEMKRLEDLEKYNSQINSAKERFSKAEDRQEIITLLLGGNVKDYLSSSSFIDKTSADFLLGKNKGTYAENPENAIKNFSDAIATLSNTNLAVNKEIESLNQELEVNIARYNELQKKKKNGTADENDLKEIRLLVLSNMGLNTALDSNRRLQEEINNSIDEITPVLKDLYEVEEKRLRSNYIDEFVSFNRGLIQEKQDDTIYAELNAWRKEQEASVWGLYQEAKESNAFSPQELDKAYNQALEAIANEYNNREGVIKSEAEDSLYKQLNAWVKAVQPKKYEGKYAEIDQWLDESLSDLTEIFTDYFTSLGKEGSELQELVNMNLEKYIPQLIDECNARKDNIDALEKQTRLQELQEFRQGKIDAINPIGGFMESFSMGSELSGTLGGIEMILLDLLAETKLVSELNSFASDYIVPMLDAILEPVRLVLPLLGEMVQTLQPILQSIFDIIYAAMPAIVSAIGVIAIILNTVSSFVKMLYQAITFQFDKIDDTYREMDQKNYEILESMHETLKAVEAAENEVAQNTSKDDGYLKALLDTGLINEAQYYEKTGLLKAGLYSDSVGRYNQTNVGNLNITISGDFSGMSEDRLARIILERFNVELKSGSGF